MNSSSLLRCTLPLAVSLLAGCATHSLSVDSDRPALIAERYTTTPTPVDNIDSVATWTAANGQVWLIASAKDVDQLVVFDGDSGANLRRVGQSGTGPADLDRPNGLMVIDDLLFVAERDNHRVHVYALPEFKSLGVFGADLLKVAYGVWVQKRADDYEVYVTDSFQLPDGNPPALAELDQRVERFVVHRDGDTLSARSLGHFGDVSERGALRWVESIMGDPAHGRLMIAEEFMPVGSTLRVYDMDGRYQQQDLDTRHFEGQAEGIALFACDDGNGYWIATDQRDDGNRFQVFDRVSLRHLGSFAGRKTSNTDGIHLRMQASPSFPAGVFFAVHDDQAVSAFDWRDIAKALALRERCAP